METLEFERDVDRVLAFTDSSAIWINGIWSVGILKETAVEYANSFNSSQARGFFRANSGQVVLIHGGATITLSEQEADAVIALIREAFG